MNTITVVTLGASAGGLTLDAMEAMKEAPRVILRTARTPVAAYLEERGIRFTSLDAFYENAEDFDRFVSLVRERDPDCSDVIDQTLASGRLAMELQFVMRRDLFCDFMDWAFALCREFERRWKWSGPSDGPAARIPAFLVERLFLVWLAIRRKRSPLKVLELPLVKLTGRPWWYVLLKPLLPILSKKANDRIYTRFK